MEFTDWLMGHESTIRLGFFLGVLGLVALSELLAPRRVLTVSKAIRWANNLGLLLLDTLLLRLLFPATTVGMATFAAENGWGIFHYLQVPFAVSLVASVVALDFIIYLQHVMLHAVPLLWRLHRVHHADLDIDVTTGTRFHPLEIILSMGIKFGAISVLGPPLVAVVIFEVVLNAMAMFNHGNLRLPLRLDWLLRLVVVTPDMHRVHHSVDIEEANSNFGFNLSCWDRLFGTYRPQPRAGHEAMTIGLHNLRNIKDTSWLPGMLLLPFKGRISDYAINTRRGKDQNEQ